MEAILRKEIITSKIFCRVIGVAIFIILTSLGAFVRIPLPFTPVPITLQTFFVLLSGAFLGSRLGAVSQLSYILLGISGLSLFTGTGSGWLYLFGPTSGYLIGFVLASLFVGKFIKRTSGTFFSIFILFCLADLILLSCGLVWLRLIFGYSLKKLFFIGFLPFVPVDLLKAWVAASIFLRCEPRIKEIF